MNGNFALMPVVALQTLFRFILVANEDEEGPFGERLTICVPDGDGKFVYKI
jgi:hypothetical protein